MDKQLTPTEAATALSIGRSEVYKLMQTGQLSRSTSAPAGASPPRHCTPTSSGRAQSAVLLPRHPTPRCPQVASGAVPIELASITVS